VNQPFIWEIEIEKNEKSPPKKKQGLCAVEIFQHPMSAIVVSMAGGKSTPRSFRPCCCWRDLGGKKKTLMGEFVYPNMQTNSDIDISENMT